MSEGKTQPPTPGVHAIVMRLFSEQALTISKSGSVVRIRCDDGSEAESVFEWLSEQTGNSVEFDCDRAMELQIEWIALDQVEPDSKVACCLQFEEWAGPIPRVGDCIAPPSGASHYYGRDDSDWLVSAVDWEFSEVSESHQLSRIVVWVHEQQPIVPPSQTEPDAIRERLWVDAYLLGYKLASEGSKASALSFADKAVGCFDRRFRKDAADAHDDLPLVS